ncbi:NUDIX hydrolase [Leuconostoc mesenteroides]|uniref:NUDIX hydrolase n=1 Tax=Leuconostoc mesenteroides TaxID=1245 RepID=UPI003B5A44EB
MEDGELPNQTAIREVNEEVQYSLGQIKYVDSFSVRSSADTNERIRVVFIANISDVKQDAFTYDPDNDENDKLEWMTLQDVTNKKILIMLIA